MIAKFEPNEKARGKKRHDTKVLRLMRERGANQEAIDAYLKDREEQPPRTINECCFQEDPLVDWDQYEVNEVWACITMRLRDFERA